MPIATRRAGPINKSAGSNRGTQTPAVRRLTYSAVSGIHTMTAKGQTLKDDALQHFVEVAAQ